MNLIERNIDIYNQKQQGKTLRELAKEYNLSRERIRQIVHKEQLKIDRIEADRIRKEEISSGDRLYSFLDALQDARIENDLSENVETRVYNCLRRAGIMQRICNGECTLADYSDEQLLKIRNFGVNSLDLARKAYDLWRNKNKLHSSKHSNTISEFF